MKQLTWKVDITRPIPCPDYKPDIYTGQYPSTHCLVYHCETVTEQRSTEVTDEQEAKNFVLNAPSSCYDFRLNGELVEDKRQRPSSITTSTMTASGTGGTHLLPVTGGGG